MRIRVDIDSRAVQRTLQRLGERARNLAPMFAQIGSGIVDEARLGFRASRDPYGVPWHKLAASTIKRRRKGSSQPLLDTGRLRNSIAWRLVGDGVEVGTNLRYAAIHQFGGTIAHAARSIRVRLRSVRVKRDDGSVYTATRFAKARHKHAVEKWGTNHAGWGVTIPARPFIATPERGLPRAYGEIIRDAVNRHFAGGTLR